MVPVPWPVSVQLLCWLAPVRLPVPARSLRVLMPLNEPSRLSRVPLSVPNKYQPLLVACRVPLPRSFRLTMPSKVPDSPVTVPVLVSVRVQVALLAVSVPK